jgi:hypothetical protein
MAMLQRDYSKLDRVSSRTKKLVIDKCSYLDSKNKSAPVLDAMFKIPESILEGKLHWTAEYEQCLDILAEYDYNISGVNERRQYSGRYSRLHLTWKIVSYEIKHTLMSHKIYASSFPT